MDDDRFEDVREVDGPEVDFDDEIADEDYGIILGPDGELKLVFMPMDYFVVPEKVRTLFKMLGIDEPEDINQHTIH